MRNLKLTILLALGVVLFVSCKKEYTCVCDDPTEIEGNGTYMKVKASSAQNAEEKCKAQASFCSVSF